MEETGLLQEIRMSWKEFGVEIALFSDFLSLGLFARLFARRPRAPVLCPEVEPSHSPVLAAGEEAVGVPGEGQDLVGRASVTGEQALVGRLPTLNVCE